MTAMPLTVALVAAVLLLVWWIEVPSTADDSPSNPR